jgi:hypothetical protein
LTYTLSPFIGGVPGLLFRFLTDNQSSFLGYLLRVIDELFTGR